MIHIHTKKVKTHHKHDKGKIFAILALISGIGSAGFWTIFPLILENKLNDEMLVGLYYSLISVIGLLSALASTYFFQKFSKVTLTKISLSIVSFAIIAMTVAENIFHLGFLDIPRAICILFFTTALSLFVKDFAKKEELAVVEGRYYFYGNIGWFLGPIAAGFIAKYFGNESVFIFSSAVFFLCLLIFLHQHLIAKHPHLHHETNEEGLLDIFKNIKNFFKNKDLIKVFLVALGLNFWWAISGIYIPLQVQEMGFSQEIVGLVVAGGILPLLFLETLVSKLASRNGVKTYIFLGFLITAIFTIFFPLFVFLPFVLLSMFILVNIGTALIEPLQETYFFETVDEKDEEKFFGIYNTADPVANIFSPILASFLIFIGGFNVLWIGTAIILFVFSFISLLIKAKK